ncbi:hypothetical protein Neosp_008970 [[Neocosmospora] mangrovei]
MNESTKRRAKANATPARPPKRRHERPPELESEPEPGPESGSEREDVRSGDDTSLPAPVKRSRGRPGKNAGTATLIGDELEALLAFLDNQRPPVREVDFDNLVGPSASAPPLTATWTQEDKDAMMVEWNASPEKVAAESIKGSDGFLTAMWKARELANQANHKPCSISDLFVAIHEKA